MKAIGDRAREVLDAKGLTLEQIIDFYLLPLPEAKETTFFPWRKVTGKKVEHIIDRRDVAALGTRWFAVDVPASRPLCAEEARSRSRRRRAGKYLSWPDRAPQCPGIYDLSKYYPPRAVR